MYFESKVLFVSDFHIAILGLFVLFSLLWSYLVSVMKACNTYYKKQSKGGAVETHKQEIKVMAFPFI